MTRLVLVSLAVASLALACTEMGRSVVLVNLTAAANVTGVDQVQVHVVGQDGISIQHAEGGPPDVKLGVYLDKSVSGTVQVQACGFTRTHDLIASSVPMRNVLVEPGKTIGPLYVQLVGDPKASPVCGSSGGAGTGGSAGGSGAGGSAGAGGSVAGAGGAAGTGGSVSGTGGVAGAGGSVAGAGGTAGGAAGRGGSGGGVAGSGGAAGTGGGAGRGGAGGAAGTGGAAGGTGGSSGFDWRGAVVISGDAVAEMRPSVAVDFSGDAVVVMEHGGEIWFNRYLAAQGMWTAQAVLAAPPVGVTYGRPVVAVDGSRRYTAVWGPGPTGSGIWQSTSADGGLNWSGAAELHTNTNLAYAPVLAVNSDGAAIVAWNERLSGNTTQVLARLRATNGTWMPMEVLMPGTDANDRRPAVAMSGVGEAFIVWEQPDGTVGMNGIWFRKYGTAGWDAALPLESFDAGPAYAPAVAANPAGNAIVSYLQRTSAIGGNAQLWARRYTGASWGTSLKVAEAVNIDSTQPPSVTLDSSGTATVAFGVDVGSRYNVFTSRQGQGETAWPTSPSAMETDNTAAEDSAGGFAASARATLPVVRSDGAGGVVLIWRKRVGPPGFVRFDLFSRRFSAGTWGAAQMIETLDTGATLNDPASVFAPALGINGSGLAVASWYYGGTNVSLDVYASVFR